MTTHLRPGHAMPRKLRWIALATTLTLGCATVRMPAGQIADPVPIRNGVPEPQVALWIEDSSGVSPEESRRASEAARTAIAEAIAGRTDYEGDAVLVVRAQGVTRTPARRKDQKLAIAGLVVGSVVVVAAVVVAVVATGGKGGGGGAAKAKVAPKPGGAGARVAAVGSVRPAPRPVMGPIRTAPAPGSAPPRRVSLNRSSRGTTVIVPRVGVWIDSAGAPAPAPRSPPGSMDGVELQAPPPSDAYASSDGWTPEDGASIEAVSLAPPPPLPLETRGFFAGDELLVELVLVDRHDGTPLWRKVVRRKVNPCDRREVRRLLDVALGPAGWTPAAELQIHRPRHGGEG